MDCRNSASAVKIVRSPRGVGTWLLRFNAGHH
jgi:hypothetical protein